MQKIKKICIHHGNLHPSDIGVGMLNGEPRIRCLICSREYDTKKRAEGYLRPWQLDPNHVKKPRKQTYNKAEITKLILTRITTTNPDAQKSLVKVVRVIVDTYHPQFNQENENVKQ